MKRNKKGFTVIELLVAVGVTALLVSLMLGIVVNITGGWNRSSGSLESGNQARVVLDQLTSDLQAAIIRNDNNVWMAASLASASPDWVSPGNGGITAAIPTTTTPPLEPLESYKFYPNGVWFRFFSTVPGANAEDDASTPQNEALSTLSAPRAIAYQIVRRPIVNGSTEIRYQLFRSEVLPNLTFTAGYDLTEPVYMGGAAADNAPGSLRSPDRANIIANNVVDFGVRILAADGTVIFPTSAGDSYPAPNDPMPDAVEVFVRILSVEGAQQLFLFEERPAGYTPSPDTTWEGIVQAHSRVYTRKVDLKAKGL